jgi:hypothetical protein
MAAADKKPVESVKEAKVSTTVIRVDADRMRLSEVLAMKELFRSHPGSSPVELQFCSGAKRVASVQIDASWGVKDGPAFQEQLQELLRRV